MVNNNKVFRKDVNALRAIAVFGVLLFHYKIELFSGGFSGVDVFFVISGYLMSKIIISAIDKQNFGYISYISKRAKRIIPVLLVVIATVLIAGFFLCFPQDYKEILKNSASSLAFLSNIFYWKNNNYFAPASESNFLLHTWSLSVEWQFYLIYPFIIILMKRAFSSLNTFKIVFFVSTISIMLLSSYLTSINATASFYLLPTRSWEMLAGGMVFLLEGSLVNNKLKRSVAIVGYILIFACFLLLDTSHSWPGIVTTLPVLGAFLVILANDNELRILDNIVVQFFGKISYSLYLWHWPLFVLTQYYGMDVSPTLIISMTLLAIFLSFLTFKFVESANYQRSGRIIFGMALLVCVSIIFYKTNANELLFKKQTLEIAGYRTANLKERDKQYRVDKCHIADFDDFNKKECLCLDENKKNILLLGDSHMGQLAQSFIDLSRGKDISFLQATASATLPLLHDYQYRDKESRELIDYIFTTFLPINAKKIDGVILTGSWSGQDKHLFNNQLLVKGIRETVEYLEGMGIKTIIIGQTERYKLPYPIIAARDFEVGESNSYKLLDSSAYAVNKFLYTNFHKSYIDVINYSKIPSLKDNKIPYMIDEHHASKYGADLIVKKVATSPKFLELLK